MKDAVEVVGQILLALRSADWRRIFLILAFAGAGIVGTALRWPYPNETSFGAKVYAFGAALLAISLAGLAADAVTRIASGLQKSKSSLVARRRMNLTLRQLDETEKSILNVFLISGRNSARFPTEIPAVVRLTALQILVPLGAREDEFAVFELSRTARSLIETSELADSFRSAGTPEWLKTTV